MNFEKGTKTLEKKCIFKIIYDFYLVQEKKFLIALKAYYFQLKIYIKLQHVYQHQN